MDYRIFVEKHKNYQVEAKSLEAELNLNLNLHLKDLRYINVYDLFGFSKELVENAKYKVFGEIVTDSVTYSLNLKDKKYVAIEYLPGQFDQRASSAIDCVKLIDPEAQINIRSGKIIILDDSTSNKDLNRIKKYLINAVEAREKDLSVLSDLEQAPIKPVEVIYDFTNMKENFLDVYISKMGLAMNKDDLKCVIDYFKKEGRDPWETELRILDT